MNGTTFRWGPRWEAALERSSPVSVGTEGWLWQARRHDVATRRGIPPGARFLQRRRHPRAGLGLGRAVSVHWMAGRVGVDRGPGRRSEEHTSELQSPLN